MANGRPGDHPLTDMLSHGSPSTYPEDIFVRVKELTSLPDFPTVRDEIADVLWEDWPRWENVVPDLDKVRRKLEAVKLRLSGENGNPAV